MLIIKSIYFYELNFILHLLTQLFGKLGDFLCVCVCVCVCVCEREREKLRIKPKTLCNLGISKLCEHARVHMCI
jgi:hypothetical protein